MYGGGSGFSFPDKRCFFFVNILEISEYMVKTGGKPKNL